MLRKATITVEVLYNEKEGFEPEGMTLEQLGYATTYGNMSGIHSVTENIELSLEDSIKECEKQGSDPDFFGLPTDITTKDIEEYLNRRGIKVQENEPDHYVELMMDNHKCVNFKDVQYYIPEDNNFDTDDKIFDLLVDFCHL